MSKKKKIKNKISKIEVTDKRLVSNVVKEYMTEYGLEVILNRSVSDIQDGQKPVQRRVLWAMHKLGVTASGNMKKVAKIVGDTMGAYHPHGDNSINDALVRMAQKHKQRYPLIEGQGNFGTWTKNPAAMRYIECRFTPIASEFFRYINVCSMEPNYDGTTQEPIYLPARLPFLLLNGSEGIGVGLTSNIPPHNLNELLDAIKAIIKKPSISVKGLMKHIKGPDYGYGLLASTEEEIKKVYENGEGTLTFQCRYNLEKTKKENIIVVTEYAPNFNVEKFLLFCGNLAEKNLINYAGDETDRRGNRLVVSFSNVDVLKKEILPKLKTKVSYKFNITKRSKKDTTIKKTPFIDFLKEWINYREKLEKRILKYEANNLKIKLRKEELKLLIATENNLDKLYKIVKSKIKDKEDMAKKVSEAFKISLEESLYIIGLPISSLPKFNIDQQQKIMAEINKRLNEIKIILKNISLEIMKQLTEDQKKYSDNRKTEIGEINLSLKAKKQVKFIAGNSRGDVEITKDILSKKGSKCLDYITQSTSKFTIIDIHGKASQFDSTYAPEKTGIKDVINIISGDALCYVVTDEDGKLAIISTKQKKQTYQSFKTIKEIQQAVEIHKGDHMFVEFLGKKHSSPFLIFDSRKIESLIKSRPNCSGRNVFGRSKGKILVTVSPKNGFVLSNKGREIEEKEEFMRASARYPVADLNLVINENSSKRLVHSDDLMRELAKRKTFKKIVPLRLKP